MHRYTSFVVRVVLDEGNSVLGAHVSHTGTQKTAYFRDLGMVLAFIKGNLYQNEPRIASGDNGSTVMPDLDSDGEDSG